jgi:hypothetical protein
MVRDFKRVFVGVRLQKDRHYERDPQDRGDTGRRCGQLVAGSLGYASFAGSAMVIVEGEQHGQLDIPSKDRHEYPSQQSNHADLA